MSRSLVVLQSLMVAVLLAGCGQQNSKAAKTSAQRGLFISTNDCAAYGKLTYAQCAAAIDQAIAIHEAKVQKYSSLISCVRAQGPDRCERTVDLTFTPRMQAFFVIMTPQPTALPLYATSGGEVGFKSQSKQIVDLHSDNLLVSVAATALANENARLPLTDSEYGTQIGASAVDIQ